MDWYDFVKKYVWDEDKTPYLVRAHKLSKKQARNELFVYAIFLGSVAVVVAAASIAHYASSGDSSIGWLAVYAMSILGCACLISLRKNLYAALFCVTVPVFLLIYFSSNGFHPNLHTVDKFVLLTVIVLWCLYAVRIVAIVRSYPGKPDGTRT